MGEMGINKIKILSRRMSLLSFQKVSHGSEFLVDHKLINVSLRGECCKIYSCNASQNLLAHVMCATSFHGSDV